MGWRVFRRLPLLVIVAVTAGVVLPDGLPPGWVKPVQAASAPAPQHQSPAPPPSRPALKVGEQPQMRTRYSTTTYNANHTFSTHVSGHPVNYRDRQGTWHQIDSTLVGTSAKGYAYQNRANSYQALFKQTLGDDYLRLVTDGQPISLSLVGASHAAAAVKGSSIEYANALPHVSARYNVGSEAVEETLVLQNRSAAASYRFLLKAPAKTTAQRLPDGSWGFRIPGRAQPGFYLTPPVAYDSGPHILDPRNGHAQIAVTQVTGGFQVDLTIDHAWLGSASRRFPVFLDPTVTIQPDSDDASFAANCASCSAYVDTTQGRMYIGTDSTYAWREALKFDLSAIPAGVNVTSASLGIYYDSWWISSSGPGGWTTSQPMDAHVMTGPWYDTSLTSDVQFDPNVLSNFTLPASPTEQWMTWNVTSAASGWISGTLPNYGLYLMRSTEPLNASGPAPPGMRYPGEPALTPQLTVTYSGDAVQLNQPTMLHSNGAELSWSQYTGPSGAAFQKYEVHRSLSPNFTPSASNLLTSISDIAVTSYRDTTAAPNGTFYYAVVANSSKSNEVKVTLPADGQASMFLQPGPSDGKDTYIYDYTGYANCANYGAAQELDVGSTTDSIYRDLLQFDLHQVPLNAGNVSAQLSLWHWNGPPAMTLHAYPLTRSWNAGTGVDSPATCTGDGATWYEATGGSSWSSQGGDFDSSTASSQVSIAANDPAQWSTFDISNIVSKWVSGQAPDLGVLIKSDNESLVANNGTAFDSADFAATSGLRPKLQVTYADGSHAIAPGVAVSSPGPNAAVSGTSVKLSATASAADGHLSQVQFQVDGSAAGTATSSPWSVTWNSTTVSNGTHTVTAIATDDAGNSKTSGGVNVTVANYAPPVVSITSPSNGATVSGSAVSVAGTASAAGGLSRVEVYVDNIRLATLTGSPFSYSWNTLDGTVYDGSHTLTAKAYDSYGQVTTSSAVSVTVANTSGTEYQAGFSVNSVPQAVVYDPSTTNQYSTKVTVTNNSSVSWPTSTYLRYRWVSLDPNSSPSVDGPASTVVALSKNKSTTVSMTVPSPQLGSGVDQAQYQLWFDLWDSSANVWFSARGNPPLVNTVTVNLALKMALGLENYYQYTQDPVGGGMTHMVNVANGNSILAWTPFNLPGRGLATAVRLTYNSLEDHSDSVAGANWSLSVSSLTRFGQPLDIHPNNNDTDTSNRWIGLIDGDGTYHRFQGATDSSGNVYYVEPPGVHLYLRQYSTTDTTRWWAFTRPDRVTFFYNQQGFPTYVTDKNGNSLTYTVSQIAPSDDPGNLKYHVTAVTDAGGRAVNIAYYSHADAPRPRIRGLVKSITDHDGHELDFFYNDDGNLSQLVQRGGVNADGSFLADRSWSFTYTTSSGSGQATNLNDESTKLYGVTDPDGHQTTFAYITSGQDKWKLTSHTDRAGNQTTFAYDDANLTTTVTEPLSRVTKYVYDATGQVTSMQRQQNASTWQTTSLQWSSDLAVTQLTEPNQAVTQFSDDANGYQTDKIDQAGDHSELRYQNIAVDAGDVSSHWCPSIGVINGSVCAPRTVSHISQLQSRTDPNGVPSGGYQWSFGYDSAGDLTQVTDPLKNPSTNSYNADGTLSQTTDPDKNTTKYTSYDANGLATTVVDAVGNTTTAGYDADGLLQFTQDPDHQTACGTCTDPSQYRTVYHYDSFNRLGAVSQPKSTSLAQGTLMWTDTLYDPSSNVMTQIAPYYATGDTQAGDKTQFSYDAMDRRTLSTGPDTAADPAGERTAYQYDAAGRLVQEVTPVGVQGGVQAGAASSPHTVNFTYDALDQRLTQTTYHADSGGTHALTTFECYDNVGNLTSVTQPDANLGSLNCPAASGTPYTSFYTYDPAHRLLTSTDGDGHQTSNGYDADSNRTKVTDPNNVTTTATYDQLNRVVRTDEPFITGSTPHTLTTEVQYDPAGNKTADISARAYDASTDKQTFTNYVTAYHYDADNRLVRTDLPIDTNNPTQYYVLQTYDPAGFKTAVSKPVTTIDPSQLTSSQKTSLSLLDPGWVYTSQDPGGTVIHFDYTAKGEQSLRAPETAQGVVDTTRQMSWDYYPDGQVKDVFDTQHQPVSYTYNADDVLLSTHNAGGLTDPSQSSVDTQNTLDDLNRVVRTDEKKQTDANWTFASYGYDANSNLTDQVLSGQESSPNGTLVKAGDTSHIDYDQANWFADLYDYGVGGSAGAPAAGAQRTLETFTPAGKEARRELDRYSAGSWPVQQVTTWDYYANGKLNHLTTTNASGSTLESHAVTYLDGGGVYNDGNRTQDVFSQQQPSGTTQACSPTCTAAYTYDPRDRLVQQNDGHGTTSSYTLDGAGNTLTEAQNGSTTKTYTYNGDQIATLTAGGQTLDYHYNNLGDLQCVTTSAGSAADCNPSSGTTPSSNLVSDYTYDYLDRMQTYRAFSGGSQTDSASYVYDALNRQVSETENHPGFAAPRTTQSSYLGLSSQLTEEQLSSGGTTTEVKDYSYDPEGNRLSFTDTPYSGGSPQSPTAYSYGYNVHDSVSQLVDPSGNVKASYGYTPYGQPDSALSQGDTNQNSPLNPFRYEAKRLDSGSQSYNTGARQYSPGSAHFLTQDVYHGALADLGLSSDLLTQDRYALAGGNPLSYLEWDGHDLTPDGGGGGAPSPSPASSQPSNSDSGGGNFWGGLGGQAKEFGQGLWEGTVQNFVGLAQASQQALECAPPGMTLGSDPIACGKDLYQTGKAIAEHPGDVLGNLIDYQDFSSGHIARGIGHVLPTLVALAITKGAGADAAAGDAGAAAEATGAAAEGGAASRLGRTVSPRGRTYDQYDSYLSDVASHYGINLRGVAPVFDYGLGAGVKGLTRASEGGWIIRINPTFQDEADLANTMAHELSHARDFQKGLTSAEGPAYAAGDALEEWINGLR